MPSVNAFQTNFSAGEISPRLFSRVDINKYPNGLSRAENFLIQRFGGARKRGGTEFIREAKTSATKVRLVPFIYSVTQAYVLEFGDLYVRFYTNGGVVSSGGSPVEVTSPWDEDEIWGLQFTQSADVLYITHPNYAPRALSRTSATAFLLDTVDFEDGPYLEINTTATTLTPADTGHITPKMTNNTTPAGYTVSNQDGSASAYVFFNRDRDGNVLIDDLDSGWIRVQLPSAMVADAYWMTGPRDAGLNGDYITIWEFQGSNDGSSWVTLDSRTGETGWGNSETRYYEFNNQVAYSYYRLNFRGGGGHDANDSVMAELAIHRAASDQTPFNLTASATTGINDGDGFKSTDVGRHIRLLGTDGRWRWAKIAAYTSSTVVTVRLYGHALPDLTPIVNWQMGAWSDETGWPASCGFFNSRLCFARTATQPQTVWMSRVEDYYDFGVSDPLQDDDAISVTLSSDSVNEIKWIAEGSDLFIGATAAIRTIGPTASTSTFAPTNIKQRRETNYGAGEVQPVRVGTTALYTGYYRNDIREIAYSFDFNGYVSQDMSILAEHIPAAGVKQLAYSQSPDSIVWFVTDSGGLAGMTFERDQEVIAFHEHVIGGTGVTVESVTTIPGTSADEVWLVVKRTINSATKRYIERISAGLSDTGVKASATFLDSYLSYSGASTTTITGLSHLEGESVYLWSGSKQGPYTVSSGSITIGTAVTAAIVGLAYDSILETLSPEAAARGGTAQAQLGRVNEVFVRVNRSMNGQVGPADGTLETLDYTKSTDTAGDYGSATELFSGDVRVPVAMEWGRQKRLKIKHSEPSPFHVLGLIMDIRVSG